MSILFQLVLRVLLVAVFDRIELRKCQVYLRVGSIHNELNYRYHRQVVYGDKLLIDTLYEKGAGTEQEVNHALGELWALGLR